MSKEDQPSIPTPEEVAKLEALRKDFWDKHTAAVQAAHALAAEQPVGNDRTRAFEVYERMRNAPRVGLYLHD